MKRWLDNWERVGPVLEAERWERLARLSDAEGQEVARDLLDLWQPDWKGDDGEGLLLHQRVFAKGRGPTPEK
jgi:hypothetical protein